MTRRSLLLSAAALVGLGKVEAAVPDGWPIDLEWLKAAVRAGVGATVPSTFTGRLLFEPVELDQKAFEYPMAATNWDEAFAESDRVRDWFAAQGYPSWSSGCQGPWLTDIFS